MRDERVHFLPAGTFHRELKARVQAYLDQPGRSPFGGVRLWVKTIVIALGMAAVWVAFLLGDGSVWQAALAGILVGVGVAGLGFCVQHDASHGAYSSRAGVNRSLARVLDLLGGSSFVWRTKHNVVHHTFTNLVGVDQDLEAGVLLRFAPGQKRRVLHRFQHVYVWFLYALLTIKWAWVDDFLNVGLGRLGPHRLTRPKGIEWLVLLGGKAFAFTWSLVIPILVHGVWIGILFHVVGHVVAGLLLSTVFQLAHCVEEADFPAVPTPPGGETEWAVHQLNTSVDFARGNPFLTWFLGGLNYQAVHHLFPKVSHVHYPALSRIVADVCSVHGVRYRTNPTMRGAIASHVRWLRRLGQPQAA